MTISVLDHGSLSAIESTICASEPREIRQYANAVGTIIAERFPRTWELFAAGR